METLGLVLAAMMALSAIWTYFDASRQRDAFQIGNGPRGLAPNVWATLAFFFFPIALPLYFAASSEAQQQSRRSGPPPVFESRGLNVYGILGLALFVAGAAWLIWEKEYRLAALCVPPALMAAFGGRRIVETGRALKIDLPKGAAWEQIGFRPMKDEDQLEDEEEDDLVVNLDRLQPPGLPLPAPSQPPASAPLPPPVSAAGAAPKNAPRNAPAAGNAAPATLRISDITWAAAEDGFDDEPIDPAPAPGSAAPRTTVAVANPALFAELGGVFAPPGSAKAASPVAPFAVPAPAAPVVPPTPAGVPSAPKPASVAPPPARPPATSRPDFSPPRPAPLPIGGAYAAARTSDSPLPQILMVGIVLLLLLAGLLWWRATRQQALSGPESTPEEAGIESLAGAAGSGAPEEAPTQAAEVAASEAPEVSEEQRLQLATTWMSRYLNQLGPVGQNLDEIDFEGFSTSRCDLLQKSIDDVELPAAPNDQVDFKLRACLVSLTYLPKACKSQSQEDWCNHLIETRRCLNETQQDIEKLWGLPGLLEFQLGDEPRSVSSMSGRCLQAEAERRSREVDPDP